MKIISDDPLCILNIWKPFDTFVFRHRIRMQDELEERKRKWFT